jgi:hypothetical protein
MFNLEEKELAIDGDCPGIYACADDQTWDEYIKKTQRLGIHLRETKASEL